jgi:hypothetical protein
MAGRVFSTCSPLHFGVRYRINPWMDLQRVVESCAIAQVGRLVEADALCSALCQVRFGQPRWRIDGSVIWPATPSP